jgi:hypothetical protein
MDTVSPSLADIAIDFVLVWTQKYPTGKLLHDPKQFPHVMAVRQLFDMSSRLFY